MESIGYAEYLLLTLLLIAWCVLHSAMISVPVTEFLKRRLGDWFRFYRLFFNLVAILTLIPVALFAYAIQTQVIFDWSGYMRMGQVLLLGLAVLLFFLGGRHYDALQFLGIKQIQEGTSNKVLTDTGELDTSGILRITRHPWYLAAILFIWARQLDVSAILVNIILTVYLIAGTYFEEKKLIGEFGEQYMTYQMRVSMLLPYKWLKSKIVDWKGR
jgi:protein-S-isoprenylcysteine O-methyltransferase Ste14